MAASMAAMVFSGAIRELPLWAVTSVCPSTSQSGDVPLYTISNIRNRLAPASAPVMVSIHFLLKCSS